MKTLHVLHMREPKAGITWPPNLEDDSRRGIDWVQNEQEHEVEDAFARDGYLHLVGDNHGDADSDFRIDLAVIERATLGKKVIHGA